MIRGTLFTLESSLNQQWSQYRQYAQFIISMYHVCVCVIGSFELEWRIFNNLKDICFFDHFCSECPSDGKHVASCKQ